MIVKMFLIIFAENKSVQLMKIAVIIPDRGDRPEFLEHCKKMLEKQTLKPETIIFVDYKPKSDKCDITERYRTAYHSLDGMNYDCILFMENDDWYAPEYIETMVYEWSASAYLQNGGVRPDVFGIGFTYYYHIGIQKYMKFDHPRRASMMNTLIKPDLNIKWCADDYPYTDAYLWQNIVNRKTFIPIDHEAETSNWFPEKIISLGIKHGIGMSGGEYHRTKLDRYSDDDSHTSGFLMKNVDRESFEFYTTMSKKAFKP